jgi:diguanylate cyclase (GGDEF)-like protein
MSARRVALFVAGFVFVPSLAIALLAALWADYPLTGRFWLVATVGSIVGSLLAYLTARIIVHIEVARPLDELSERAEAVSRADPSGLSPIELAGSPDMRRLVEAFNKLIGRVWEYVEDLEDSRLQFRRAIGRVGDALASTDDRATILEVVLEMGVVVTRGDCGVLWLPRANSFIARYTHGVEGIDGNALERGAGLAGWVGHHDLPRFVDDPAQLSPLEPEARHAVAVPIRSRNRVFGVLAVYGRDGDGPADRKFGEDDLMSLRTIAVQAEAAIENTFLHEETSRLSLTDGLTGVWNRRHFDVRLSDEIDRSARFRETFSLVLLDLDWFKSINDEHGHLAGDYVLVEVARRLKACTRQVDVVARYGGEEFALILPRTSLAGGQRVAEKVRTSIEREPFVTDDDEVKVTVSIGVASYPESAFEAHGLVAAADAALYRAKAEGKNQVRLALPPAD